MTTKSDRRIIKAFYKRSTLKDKGTDNFVQGCKADVTVVKAKTQHLFKSQDGQCIVDPRIIAALSPDSLDPRVFWREATRHFPWIPISGHPGSKSRKDVNYSTWSIHSPLMHFLSKAVYKGKPDAKMLEIGPGYGGVMEHVRDKHGLDGYWCIDVNPLFQYERMVQTDGKTIPGEVPHDLDIIYSVNVFQHLSGIQRRSYFRQAAKRLIGGGIMAFTMFILTDDNADLRLSNGGYLFGSRDVDGNRYSQFFNQYIRIPHEREVLEELQEAGLTPMKNYLNASNSMVFLAGKA